MVDTVEPVPVELSVVVISHNEGAFLRRTVENLLATLPVGSELVLVDDASTDDSVDFLADGFPGVRFVRTEQSLGAPAARNLGAAHTSGRVIVFCDAHVEVGPGWSEPLCAALRTPSVAVVGPVVCSLRDRSCKGFGRSWKDAGLNWRWLPRMGTDPYAVPMVSGCFLAVRGDLFRAGGFDPGLLVWGEEGAELCLRFWRMGYECQVVPEVEIGHLFRSSFPHEVTWELVLHNRLRVGMLHFDEHRLANLIANLRGHAAFPRALVRLLHSDVWQRRAHLDTICRRDGDSFFRHFDIDVLDG